MLDQLIRFSVHNKFIISLFVIALIGVGIYSMRNIAIDAVPDITNNQVQIVTSSPSLAAQEVEQFITYPIEMAMANIQNTTEIRSISRYGLSVITVVFEESVPVLDARQLVGQQLQIARQEIPQGYGQPELMPITTGLGEIYQYTLDIKDGYKDAYTPTKLRTIHDWIVKRQLNGIPGIVEISSFGGFLKQYEIAVNPNVLKSYNITLADINTALLTNNENTGGSYIQKGAYAYYIRTNGLLQTITDIENIVVDNRGGLPILLRDVADINISHPPRFGAMTKNGKGEAVGGITLMLKGANASKVIAEVKERIEQIQTNLPEGLEINPYLDRSELVNKVIATVRNNLIEGGLIVIFVLVLLLGNLRAGVIVASVIPLSMLFAFTMMYIFDVTATVMSLGAIDFGLIVDGTVIIVEGILHQLQKRKMIKPLSQRQMNDLVTSSTVKIRSSATFGAIIILIVYIPILSLTGIEGKMFRPMALTVGFAILGALILSFTYVPMISSLFLSKKIKHKRTLADRIMDFLYRTYRPVLNLALRYKRIVLISTFALLLLSIFVFTRLGAVFIPNLDEGDLAMQMTIPPGSSLNESIKTSTKAEQVLLENFPEVEKVVSKIGTAEVPTDPMAIEDADIMIILKEHSEWETATNREDLINAMKEKLGVITGAQFEFTQPIQLRFNELLTGAKSDVAIKIYGENMDTLFRKANEAAAIISEVQGAADIKVEQTEGLPQLIFNYDRKQIARYGLNIQEVNTMVRTALAGEKAGLIFEGERKFDLVVRLESSYREDVNTLENLSIRSPNGQLIPLKEIADLQFVEGPMQISRDNTQRRISIGINVRNRDVQSLVEEIQDKLSEQFYLPPGYFISYGGQFENLQSAVDRLQVVVPVAVAMIFILLYFAFNSLKQTLIIILTIPLSVIGGIFSLWLRGMPFSISAGVGFIALFGVAVLDGIVLINYLNDLKKEGISDVTERIIQGTKVRLRPVAVTSAVASLGFLPMAIATSTGAEVQRPLATVVIGGLITATFLTMIVLPLVYYFAETKINWSMKNKKILTILLLLAFPGSLLAQKQDTIQQVSLDEAMQIAVNNNISVENAHLRIEQAIHNQKQAFSLGATELEWQRGEINSEIVDNSFAINQNFGNIFSFPANRRVATSQKTLAETSYELSVLKTEQNVNTLFYIYLWYANQENLLDKQIALYTNVANIAKVRYETGETSQLEQLMLENEAKKLEQQQHELIAAKRTVLLRFNQALRAEDTIYKPEYQRLDKILIASQLPADNSISNTESSFYEQQIDASKANLTREKTRFLPELYAGYFRQQIDGQNGFDGWQAGVALPLFGASALHHSVQTAKIEQQIAENNLQEMRIELQTNYRSLTNELNNLQAQLTYFDESALPVARLLRENTEKLYETGEITYIEYLQNMREVLQIELEQLQTLHQYNQTVIQLNYLLK